MTLSQDRDPKGRDKDCTELFTVVGAPYVPEQHNDSHSHFRKEIDELPAETGVAVLWLALYVAIFGVALFSNFGASRVFAVAWAFLK